LYSDKDGAVADKSRRGYAVPKKRVADALPVEDSKYLSVAEMVAALAGAMIEMRLQLAALEQQVFKIRLQLQDNAIRLPTLPFDQ
jgi:hypothetical protein